MQGLFKRNTKTSSKGKLLTCADCGLFKFAKSPRMPPNGKGRKGILVVAESNGVQEDKENKQLVGQSGKLLRSVLEDFDIDLDKDCIKTNACICYSQNKIPTDTQIKCCRPNLFKTIKEYKPKKIILLGASALKSAIGEKIKIGSLEKWTGQQIPDQDIKSWLFPTYHPSFILRDSKNKALDLLFKKHLRSAIEHNIDFPDYGDERSKINVILDENKAVEYLRSILDNRYIAFDYEATGIKLNAKGHKIICMSIATDKNAATAFPMFYEEIFQDLLKKILTNFWVKKAIQNSKYEFLATKCILGYEVQGIYRDTMLNAHVLDNREEVTGLKFQTYVKYGTSGYNSTVEPYMESDEDFGNNSFNKLDILFKRDPVSVLTYCGMDSMFTFRLGEDQADELLKNNLYNGANLLLEGTLALADVENNGIRVDTDYYRNQDLIQDRKIRRINKKIKDSSEVKEWNKIKRTEFNPDSPTQLNNLFYDILKYEPTKLTNKGAPSVNKEVLFDLNTEFANLILAYRKEVGLKEKINGILIETVDGILRCHYNLNLVRSYRSSTNSVNWQNFPKRDRESFKIARSGIIPRKGHCIGEVDYGQIEVRIGSCYHHDPVMIKYITDPTTDLHRDSASEIFLLEQDQVTKKIRYHAKNKFVFPAFYGSFYAQMSPDLYKCVLVENLDDGTSLIKHLKKHGISSYEKFELHLKDVENIFWKERFKVYDEWKTKTWEEYQRKGYIDSLTGFRYSGLMKKNDTLNLGIQGSAFHCLLQSLITLNNISKKEKWDSKIIGQIHDSMVWDFNPDELNHIIPIIKRVMCEDIKKKWEWITIPLVVDIEVAEVNSSWYDMKEYSEDEDD